MQQSRLPTDEAPAAGHLLGSDVTCNIDGSTAAHQELHPAVAEHEVFSSATDPSARSWVAAEETRKSGWGYSCFDGYASASPQVSFARPMPVVWRSVAADWGGWREIGTARSRFWRPNRNRTCLL